MKQFLENKLKGIIKIEKIEGEASRREFYRIFLGSGTVVAMAYPEENRDEIEKVINLTNLYAKHKIRVPDIIDVIDNCVVLQEDLGNQLFQNFFSRLGLEQKKRVLESIAEILSRIRSIPVNQTNSTLDHKRMKWEMDFFLSNFVEKLYHPHKSIQVLTDEVHGLVDDIQTKPTFAHRDFHTRNMLVCREEIYLVDIQDSLIGPEYYDLVSFAFDSYQNLGSLREDFFRFFKDRGYVLNEQQLYLTALQRNIKALGTFGFQINVKNNRKYRKYIKPTIEHIRSNSLAALYVPSLLDLFV